MTPADHIALKAAAFVKECFAHDFTGKDIHEILHATIEAQYQAWTDNPAKMEEEFMDLIRRQQIINKVSTTCERLRRGLPLDFDLTQPEGN